MSVLAKALLAVAAIALMMLVRLLVDRLALAARSLDGCSRECPDTACAARPAASRHPVPPDNHRS